MVGHRRAVLAATLLVACAASGRQAPRAVDRSPTANLEKYLAKHASGAQAGTVREVEGGHLVLAPYEPGLTTEAIPLDGAAPVFRDGERISEPALDALLPGMDVKVFLGGASEGETPPVLGVKILSVAEARELRAAVEHRTDLLESDRSGIEEQYGGVSWQAGEIRELTANALVLEPYQPGASKAVLRLDGQFDVYRGAERVGREALRPGEDVRVYFDERTGIPRVLGVEILKEAEARRLRDARR